MDAAASAGCRAIGVQGTFWARVSPWYPGRMQEPAGPEDQPA